MASQFEFVILSYLTFSCALIFAAVKNLLKSRSTKKTFYQLQHRNAEK